MASKEFDHDRWPEELRALAATCDAASDAWIDHIDDKDLKDQLEVASESFHQAHRAWLGEHWDRIPGLIAHRLRERRRRRPYYSYESYEAAERMREWERAEIDELWALHREAQLAQAPKDERPSPPQPTGSPKFTVEVASVTNRYDTALFGVFDTFEEAESIAERWRRDARSDGLTALFISATPIHDVSAYAAWVEPERQRMAEDRAAADLAVQRTWLLLEFHDDEAIKELGPNIIAEAVTQTGRFEVVSIDEAAESYRRAAHAAGRILAKSLAVTERKSPEGTVVSVVVKTTIDLAQFRIEHGQAPRGQGTWHLRNTETGEELTRSGMWGEVRAGIPGGDWTLLP